MQTSCVRARILLVRMWMCTRVCDCMIGCFECVLFFNTLQLYNSLNNRQWHSSHGLTERLQAFFYHLTRFLLRSSKCARTCIPHTYTHEQSLHAHTHSTHTRMQAHKTHKHSTHTRMQSHAHQQEQTNTHIPTHTSRSRLHTHTSTSTHAFSFSYPFSSS